MTFDDIVVILSRPAESGNVGAVCRAMKNMGFTQLRIVSPESPLDDEVIRARAVHATDVWDSAARYDALPEAIADCSLVVGTTRRRGKKRKDFTLTPEELGAVLKTRTGRAAIIFGNERTGLEETELNLCNLASHIPANEIFPSLNLSHAVQVFAYALSRALNATEERHWVPVDAAQLSQLVDVVGDSLQSIGFYKQAGREDQERFFRDLFARSGITIAEARYLESIFRKIARLSAEGDRQ